jgi:hypothetical protein
LFEILKSEFNADPFVGRACMRTIHRRFALGSTIIRLDCDRNMENLVHISRPHAWQGFRRTDRGRRDEKVDGRRFPRTYAKLANLIAGQWGVAPVWRTARRVLILAILLLPGTVIVLPLLLWLDRHASRRSAPLQE